MAKHFRFNLLIRRERAALSEAVSFLNTYAKYVIVLTQILVLFVFFIKIILDQTVIDLKEAIDQKNQIILTASEMIDNNNVLAKKLREIDAILAINDFRFQTVKTVIDNIPRTITVNSVDLQKNKIVLDAQSVDPVDIQKLQLKLSQKVTGKVQVRQISKDINIYYFKLDITDEKQTS